MRFVFFLLFFSPFVLAAQNLIMNGDFEEENLCTEYGKNCAPEGWISSSTFAVYYFDDDVHAYTGRHFAGLVLARSDKPTVRNFLRSRLLCGLHKGAKYRVEFFVRSKHFLSDSVGIYFSEDDFLYKRERLANSHPQLFINRDSSIKPTGEWQKVSLVYEATGEENFINVGDFKTKGIDFKKEATDLNRNYYFFFDNITLVPLNPTERLCTEADSIKKEEYSLDVRHSLLDRFVYENTKNPHPLPKLAKTVLQHIDTVTIPDVLFAVNSYTLTNSAYKVLDSFSLRMNNVKLDSIVVEGHTDAQGKLENNIKLSENRASSVADYLKGALACTFFTRGWASYKPVADNKTPAGRQKNRRVEIYIYVRD